MKVSIIIPVYNHENYIDRCLNSIRDQTYKNFELIVINDGSTDGTIDKLNGHAIKDDRISVINQANRGTYLARTNGLKKSTGEVIMHLDSDDYLEPNAIEILVKEMHESDADIVICNHYLHDDSRKVLIKNQIPDNYNELSLVRYLLLGKLTGYLWGKLYKRRLFDNIELPIERAYSEDVLTNFKIFTTHSVKIALVPDGLVHYVIHGNNISYSSNREPVEGFFEEFKLVEEMLRKKEYRKKLKLEIAIYKCKNWIVYCRKGGLKSKNKKYHKKYFRKNYRLAKTHLPWYLRLEMTAYAQNIKIGKLVTASMKFANNMLRMS